MIIYKNPMERKLVLNAKLEEVLWEDTEAIATIRFADRGTEYKMNVKFVNAPVPTLPQMYTRLEKVRLHEPMVVLLKQSGPDFYAINFATDGEAFNLAGRTVFCGRAKIADTDTEVGPVCGVKIKATNGRNRIAVWQGRSNRLLPQNDNLIIIAHDGKVDSHGDLSFYGDKAYPMDDFIEQPDTEKLLNTVISIGCYKKNPIKLKDIFDGKPRQSVLGWMTYVADEWNPPTISAEEMAQKKAISLYLKTIAS